MKTNKKYGIMPNDKDGIRTYSVMKHTDGKYEEVISGVHWEDYAKQIVEALEKDALWEALK